VTLAGAAVMARPAVGGAWDPSMLSPALWVDPSDLSTVTISGSSGAYIGPTGLVLPGTSGNVATTADSAAVSPTTAVEIVARARATWSASVMILAKRVGGAETSLQGLQFGTQGGALSLFSNNTTRAVTHALTDGAWYWLKVTADGTATRFYFAADQDAEPSSWTQVGTDQGASSFVDTGHLFSIGGDSQSGWYGLNVKRLILRKTIGGSADFDADFTAPNLSYAMSFTEGSTNAATVTITSSTNGAAVSQINDKSGNGRHLTQATLVNMPALQRIGGITHLVWDGINDYLTAGDVLDVLGGNWTYAAVGISQASGQQTFFSKATGVTSGNVGFFSDTGVVYIFFRNDGTASLGYGSGRVAGGGVLRTFIARLSQSAMKKRVWVDGGAGTEDTLTSAVGGNQANNLLVSRYDPGGGWSQNGRAGDHLVVSAAISDADVAALQNYLKTKWGTP